MYGSSPPPGYRLGLLKFLPSFHEGDSLLLSDTSPTVHNIVAKVGVILIGVLNVHHEDNDSTPLKRCGS